MKPLIKITDLHVSIDGKPILNGLNLTVNKGEVHAIMGPNGSGKSTLANVLAGREEYTIESGTVEYEGEDLLSMDIDKRALAGIFLAFQYPVEIPGVSNSNFLKSIINAKRKYQGLPELNALEMLKFIRAKLNAIEMDESLLKRSLNDGFSGGEKKRNEILQMTLLEPKLAILDETDSGLDIDALRIVAEGVNQLRSPERSFIVVTHYQRLLNHIIPDFVHVLSNGKILATGDRTLAEKLEVEGYDWIKESNTVTA
ncbi:MAG: Fe-S cluster assembly ATPase SufC [Saprospiraceae bacterium]|jgi:Fe-S cluster assembly ATP-binding protein|nr:Fe-S cluster assembly ATPase SufC [Candidatus Opimibacter skivensis]MBP8086356.1 Fe-S cluster assembly ATPase SufC [Saprospiraceae bacterium]